MCGYTYEEGDRQASGGGTRAIRPGSVSKGAASILRAEEELVIVQLKAYKREYGLSVI